MLSAIGDFLNTPGFNSIVLLVGVLVALRQLKHAEDAVKAQLLSVKEQIEASKGGQEASIAESRLIAKRRETARLLLESRGDEKLQRGWRAVDMYYNGTELNIKVLASQEFRPTRLEGESDDDYGARCLRIDGDRSDITYLLNHFENVAICIERGIFCRDMIVDAWRTIMIDSFRHSRALIDAWRAESKNTAILIKFQTLVQELEAESR
ncbi:DUF4760 domain-containing protein [Stenotrophomonas sp. T8]|uniref:DUF4760 domain-containing protein n=1 Tax=Stenotrophomonas sp. T8 TaxID=3446365 RepID=UPI003F6F27FC